MDGMTIDKNANTYAYFHFYNITVNIDTLNFQNLKIVELCKDKATCVSRGKKNNIINK